MAQAQSHTSDTSLRQAENSLEHATRAVQEIQEAQNQIAVERLNKRLESAEQTLSETRRTQ
ncbi:hypothetical protein [Alicyclobacillus suci]|uniref:hypothetical protein n=1 Tax=Alicyclobacillus suci TaxID=2816080 RepID=UPI001A8D41E6|nr:hypothetical protein [Alicyclobacillus suci]